MSEKARQDEATGAKTAPLQLALCKLKEAEGQVFFPCDEHDTREAVRALYEALTNLIEALANHPTTHD